GGVAFGAEPQAGRPARPRGPAVLPGQPPAGAGVAAGAAVADRGGADQRDADRRGDPEPAVGDRANRRRADQHDAVHAVRGAIRLAATRTAPTCETATRPSAGGTGTASAESECENSF